MTNDMNSAGRTECRASEVPRWAVKLGGGLIALRAGSRSFVSTQHLTVSADAGDIEVNVACSDMLVKNGWTTTVLPPAAVGRAYATQGRGGSAGGYKLGFVVCNVGTVRVNLRYVLLVERIFPGCQWAAPASARIDPVQAYVGGVLVAMVAGQDPAIGSDMVGEDDPSNDGDA